MSESSRSDPERVGPKAIVLTWWASLKERRGDRAELRRADHINGVIMLPAFQRLWLNLQGTAWSRAESVALIAAVLSQVKEHDPRHVVAEQLATPRPGSDKAIFSGLRFRRLLQRVEPEELLAPMTRSVRMLGNQVNVTDLAESLYWWNDQTRRRWAFAYYGKNPKSD